MIILFIFILAFGPATEWSSALDQKIERAVLGTYAVTDYRLAPLETDFVVNSKVEKDWTQTLFEIQSSNWTVGYLYVDQAPSMKNKFDYCLMFDKAWNVKNAKVLIYREQHGRQIGSKRWLSQFFDFNLGSSPELGQEVDGISGATISCKSFTSTVKEVLANLNRMQTNGTLN